MGKNILAGIGGVITAIALVWIVESAGHAVYPPPPDLDFADPDVMRVYIDSLPVGALLFVAAAWFIGPFGGTFAACRVGSASPLVFVLVVGGLMLIATAVNLLMIPHPMWFSALGIIAVCVGSWLGMLVGRRGRSAT